MVYNPNQATQATQRQRQAMQAMQQMQPTQATQGQRQSRPMSNTTATKPTGVQGQVYRPNAAPTQLPPQQNMGGGPNRGLMAQATNSAAPGLISRSQPTMAGQPGQAQQGQAPAQPAANRSVVIAPPAPPAATPTMGFDAGTMTVEGRLQGLMASDNPLMQQARLQAQQESAARGLQNSSLAVQSGQQAAYASMMPIASQDATTVYDSEKTEYGTRADSALMNQDYLNSRGLAQQGFGYDSRLMDKDIEGKRSIQLDRFGQETSLQEGDFAGRTNLQDDQQAANVARDATKFTSDTSLQAQGITGQKELQGTQIISNEQIASDRNATAIKTTQIGASAQIASANISASAAVRVASANNAAAAARQKTQLQGQVMLNAQTQSYAASNMDKDFTNTQTLQTQRISADTDRFQMGLDSQHQLSYGGNVTTLQVGAQQEHSAIAQNPEMNTTQKAEAHTDVTNRFGTDSSLLASIYGFGGE
jgi:hypothetical protein